MNQVTKQSKYEWIKGVNFLIDQWNISERSVRTLNNKIFEFMTSVSKNVYTDNLADIVRKYNTKYHSTIKTKPADVKSSIHINFNK